MSDDKTLKLTDQEVNDILKFYKTKYTKDYKESLKDVQKIMVPQIFNQRYPPNTSQLVDENEFDMTNILTERLSFEQANDRLSEWLSNLSRREQFEVGQIIQEIARDTLIKEIDSGEVFLRDLLKKHKETMFNVMDPEIRRVLHTESSSYVMDLVEEERLRDLPQQNAPTLTDKQAKDFLQKVIDEEPDAKKYIQNLTKNRELKKALLKDRKVDAALSGGKDMRDFFTQNTNNCLKEDNDLKNLRITLKESLEVFEQINIKDEEWEKLKESYKELSIKIAEQEVIKSQLSSYQKNCNIM
jgi:hypothetical protein